MSLIENTDDFIGRHPGQLTITPVNQPKTIQIPGNFFPHADAEGMVWVILTPIKLKQINTGGRSGRYIPSGERGTSFRFLAPEEIIDVHNHDWQEYESFHSKLLEKIRALHVGVEQFKQITGQTIGEAKKVWTEKSAASIIQKLEASAIRASESNIPSYKIDTPLTYQTSGRREVTLDFKLASADGGADIMEAVRLIQKYSAAQIVSTGIYSIQFPFIWRVESDPPGLLFFKRAACTSIQPTFKQPFNGGNSCVIDLSLSFKDLDPLFSSFLDDGDNIITVQENKSQTTIDKSRHGKIDEEMLRRARDTGE